MSLAPSTVGFRVKSGWATAVLVSGSVKAPQVVDRRAIDLCDLTMPETRQPYHAGIGQLETNETIIKRRKKIVTRAADHSVADLLYQYKEAGHLVRAAGLVVGSLIDPDKVANPHIRAHALEGYLFRRVLENALRSFDLPCMISVEREVYAHAAQALKRSEEELKRILLEIGRSVGGPWRADEKAAALAGWMALANLSN